VHWPRSRTSGVEIPERPKSYTREEKVYALLADFRDQLKRIPSDPKAVARTTEDFPVVAANSLDDFEEMARWLTEFASEMRRIVEGAVEGAKK
jgi:hypothetical protein